MKLSPLFSIILILMMHLPITAQEIAPFPNKQWIRSYNTDIQHIELNVQFDWQQKQVKGVANITLHLYNAADKVMLDAGFLTINTIKLNNSKELSFTYDGGDQDNGLIIQLDKTYATDEPISLSIDYHSNYINETDPNNLAGSNGKGVRFLAPSVAEPTKRKQIWSIGEPTSNRYWFPCYDAPNDLRTTAFIATVDSNLTVVSNGQLISKKKNMDGSNTFHYQTNIPYANYLTSFVVGEYIDVQQNYADIILHNYCYPHEVEGTKASVARLPDMVKFFSEKTGKQYPYSSYSQIFVQDIPWGISGMSIATQTENMIDDYGTHADFLYLWDMLEGESLAQQWFGTYITVQDWGHFWLSKAFARYFSCWYDEYKNGHAEFLLYQLSYDQSMYMFDWNAGIKQPVVNKRYEDVSAFTSGNYANSRGALVLHMLRKELGEENWQKAIQYYVAHQGNKLTTTEDFRKAVEAVSGQSMEWFFDQWLFKVGHPIFNITKHYDDATKTFTLNVTQTQQIDSTCLFPQNVYFQGNVLVEIDHSLEKLWIAPQKDNIFTFNLPNEPLLVNFDYEGTWIKEMTFEKPLEELLYQLKNDPDVVGMMWAMNALTTLAQNEETSTEEKQQIITAYRNIIRSDVYWRIKTSALSQIQRLSAGNPSIIDNETLSMLQTTIEKESSWVRASAIRLLGTTMEKKYADIYVRFLKDSSDRVVNAAAIALGKTKSTKAYPELLKLKNKPSWKNQSLISALNGLKELGDPRGGAMAIDALSDLYAPRWSLATPIWDFRLAAAETLVALNQSDKAFPMILDRFKQSLKDGDLNIIFNNLFLITTLSNQKGVVAFDWIKEKYRDNEAVLQTIATYESPFLESLKK
ncbi:MAG: HEAT repeat domain-containing protein [Chitinophagales bacterium]|nr:HEAT repeat domain-containing protein [Chitinophagales bacterium]